jgi:hypothetical protein
MTDVEKGLQDMDEAQIGSLVPRQRGAGDGLREGIKNPARSEVLHRHAKLMKNGRPVFCTPSLAELAGRVPAKQSRGTDGKVIYPTREAAEAAARELEGLGARSLRSYVCGRSRRGHYHLTTDTGHRTVPAPRPATSVESAAAEGPARPAYPVTHLPLHLRIPRQAGPRAS